ncbi:bifunctional [glutamine synthetase] adenylyltransferase/[glutamine synthetase]-adenylyl-L-tyrosine phosphorylase [Micromonospora endophytica]|uniref:Bifunctional glutamine-synthetase adenylyltransferase/deadenyltransferase n=1 Tax=Micromonospora endophytica TaxID=515350 RepID=A0A2W2D881_9ACTN|nr:bifunctional [glutamine synthetase] adenylyltransferase/[glutamine synthetase]-adenylyl-L-tyrosine phosphorylase [Micromonospora endophytica]PZG00039.1 bifunctional glutamine-synthetase adenylyltransferase/deadenyltransferase [Micromonospora endophytica]RIW47085.1 bifunctional [glutamine synthetase] adenylyltransferase/[glutamine synthetase]-adenylyl-L-tyrosine phosphorylase [Micromonospora endophytica]BCJ61024.1 glutamate-ammonia-ligase adenylyltransferase [Micromonospora endophytica]
MGRPTSATSRLARYGFGVADDDARARAADLLGPGGLGLWRPESQEPTDDRARELLTALSRAADPDLALRQLHRLVEAERRAEGHPNGTATEAGGGIGAGSAMLAALDEDPGLRRRLIAVLGASSALGDHLVANPDQWPVLGTAPDGLAPAADGRLDLQWTPTTPPATAGTSGSGRTGAAGTARAGRAGAGNPVAALRRAYRLALLRIAAADLTGGRGLEQTMAALSTLADATLTAAYAIAVDELPEGTRRPRLAVVAMGKCGGGELNYVSDVDVIFVAAEDDDLTAATTVATRLIHICGLVAWPVDAALRPEGNRGPLVRTLASHLAYYRRWARTWEFQALLKARPAAGDLALGREWIDTLAPLLWQAAERPEAVEDVRAMRRKIIDNIPPKEQEREIKRGPGGLRDIEFAVQLLQLVHGRGDESLRVPGTIPALRALVTGGYVGRADGEALLRGYRFLRGVEHRLQLQGLRRTHTVPTEPGALRWLAAALGHTATPGRSAVEEFRAEWVTHATEVRRLHAKLLYRPLLESVARVPADGLRLTPQAARNRLEILGFADPAGALRHLEALTGGVSRTAAIQRTLLPVLLSEFADAPEPDRGLLNYRQVSDSLGSTPWYLRLLRDSGPVARRLARVLSSSRYVADLLAREPEALRLLAEESELRPRPREVLCDGFAAAAARHASDPVEAIRAVRALRRRELLRLACADVLSRAGSLAPTRGDGERRNPGLADIITVGTALAAVTDATLAAALHTARAAQPDLPGLKFAVIGMGRLGGYESNYLSDADVLFVYEPPEGVNESAASAAAQAIAEELRRLLGMPAPDPALGVDADLRPEGRQGPLVRSLAAYQQYYARWSRVWEAQALLRARCVAGDADLGTRFEQLVDPVRYPADGLTREQIIEIRRIKARVETERLPRGADPATHTKLGRGALADVEWAVQLLQLRHAGAHPQLRGTRTLDALTAARDAGLVDPVDAEAMAAGWTLAAQVRNALMLVRGRAGDQLPRHGVELAGVVRLLGADDPGEFLDEYLRTGRRSRAATQRVLEM